jgi:4-hydroxy-tetrahydrodipicolinate synthase
MKSGFGRLITAMVTPFKEGGQVDYDKAADLADFLVENGSQGLVVTGTTGESPSLQEEEKLTLYRVVKDRVGGKAKVIAGTGGNCTEESAALSMKAAKTGVDGIMLVTPYYNKPTQEGLEEHFKTVAEAVGETPVMLYNVPSRTGVNLESGTAIRLARVPNIVALKEASSNLKQIARVIQGAPADFTVYSGNDDETLPILSIGGGGIVSVASHIIGKEIADMMALFFAGNIEEAARMHRSLLPIFEGLFMDTNPLPVKAALKMMGHDTGGHRLPLKSLSSGKEGQLMMILRDMGLL